MPSISAKVTYNYETHNSQYNIKGVIGCLVEDSSYYHFAIGHNSN